MENNHEHMCMEGPKEKVDVRAPVEPAVRKLECSPHSIKNGIPGCGPPSCRGTGMFDDTEKKIAEVYLMKRNNICKRDSEHSDLLEYRKMVLKYVLSLSAFVIRLKKIVSP